MLQTSKLSLSTLLKLLPPRPLNAHKGDFGHVLIIGGDYGMAGAVRMAGEAALRMGTGLVSVATRPDHIDIVSATRPELMCHGIHKPSQLKPLLDRANVIVLGPGLGQSTWSKSLWQQAIKSDLPKVVDADALNLLSKTPKKQQQWILTPHVGEAARLLKTTSASIQNDRELAVLNIQQQYQGVAVLKGAGTLIVGPDKKIKICRAGNPGMASGGMGDVLSGVIGGLMAQGLTLQSAAELGVCLHASAGDRAAKEGARGLLALDLMPYLRKLANPK